MNTDQYRQVKITFNYDVQRIFYSLYVPGKTNFVKNQEYA